MGRSDRAVGLCQHHDAVSGTAKQATTDDYARHLYRGLNQCQVGTLLFLPSPCFSHLQEVWADILTTTTPPPPTNKTLQLGPATLCLYANESVCELSQGPKPVNVRFEISFYFLIFSMSCAPSIAYRGS
jgi:hypothetical protein